ncbi:UNVERIFIED_CONTAM: hypothetical protein PYX00_007444 [Menopon gallinae]|uniref:FAM193 C-terminal domain-containing protein n=1 Tax=Menopon gallinae TaxID=328185 RepID=A0AAW2HK56_9NEOP
MNCASSERAENSKGFDCRNMGEVLSKECVKDEPSFTHTTEDTLKEVGAASENESDKEVSVDLDEDISWLLSFNTDELSVNKCKCEGCLRRNESYNSEKKNAKLLLTSWKEFQSYLRNVYINSPPESAQSATIPIEENERLHEIIQVMRLCDPYQLFQKIEDEVKAVVLQSRNYQLNLLKNESNPAAAKDFITGLIEKYVKLLSSAQQLSSAIDLLLGSQFQRFGFTWHLLNKHLYQSLLFTHKDVQEKLPEFRTQMEIFALKDELYHELLYDYMRMEDEMLAVGAAWEKIEPVIEEYKNSKAREVETLNDLQDILKSFFANRLNAVNGNGYVDGNSDFANDDASQYCLNCLTRRGCPCDECTVTHMLSCEGMDSPLTPDSPVSRSRSPIKEKDVDNKGEVSGEEEQSCECHACTVPPPELMDCSVTFNQLSGKNTHGEGFQLYPHIHGTVTDNLYEAENISNLYSNLQTASDSVYPHLYNLHNQANSIANVSQINIPGTVPNRTQLVQPATTNKVQPQAPVTAPQERNQLLTTTTAGNQLPNCAPTLPPPPPNTPTKPLPAKAEKVVTPDTQKKPAPAKPVPVAETKLTDAKKVVLPKENDVGLKPAAEKSTPLPNSKPAAPCVKPSLCGDACTLKHSANGMKTPCCGKKSEKRRAAIARLGLARNTNSRSAIRCPPGKENEHTHKPGKGHSCGKLKPHDISKKVANGKMNGQEPDDSSSQDDTCSERSNSVSAQRDSRHCDCCYCEVFGHNGPSVAPVSRNYQEMRERLRIRLNMKKSAKCKAGQGQVGDNKTTPGAANSQGNTANDGKQKVPKEKDLESLLKFIEGKTREECKDPKRLAKRARQKKRKLEEKERMMEEEADRKRLEAMKKQVTISVVNDNNKKGKQNQAQQPQKNSNSSSNHSKKIQINKIITAVIIIVIQMSVARISLVIVRR